MTDRERFLARCYSAPLVRADAIVVLAGEDATPRLERAVELFASGGAARIVVTGGKHDPPRWQGATDLASTLYANGIAPDRVIVEPAAMNTHEQAVNVTKIATANGWTHLLLVASAYHMPRALLSFIAVAPDTLRIVPAPVRDSAWCGSPDGMRRSRMALLETELIKVHTYQDAGHVASYATGLGYLDRWETR